MKYRFSDIYNTNIDTSKVLFVVGQYAIFNNIVIDRLRSISYGKGIDIDISLLENIVSEFPGNNIINKESFSNTVSSIDEFLILVKTPPITGKWFCSIDIKQISSTQMKKIEAYYKKPSDNGILVVYATEWKDYKGLLRNRVLSTSNESHIIQLSFPYRKVLADVVKDIFSLRGKDISSNAVDLFIMRMSSAYDEYSETIGNICYKISYNKITYDDMKEALKGIENYVIDDFIDKILVPMHSKKICKNRKIYKMLVSLSDDIGYRALLNKLVYKIDDYLEMRLAINNGIVPVSLRYGVGNVKDKLSENSRLRKLTEYSFRKCVYIASRTSLKDWYYMKVILLTAKNSSNANNDNIALKAILAVIHRSVVSNTRIINDMGITNIMEEGLVSLNKVFYNPYIRFVSKEDKERLLRARDEAVSQSEQHKNNLDKASNKKCTQSKQYNQEKLDKEAQRLRELLIMEGIVEV